MILLKKCTKLTKYPRILEVWSSKKSNNKEKKVSDFVEIQQTIPSNYSPLRRLNVFYKLNGKNRAISSLYLVHQKTDMMKNLIYRGSKIQTTEQNMDLCTQQQGGYTMQEYLRIVLLFLLQDQNYPLRNVSKDANNNAIGPNNKL